MDKKICRLCLQTISGDYVAIKQSFNDILNMNMNISKEAVKCIDCADNLEVFLKFKSACDYMKDRTDLKEDINLITITEEDHLISPKESIKCCFCTKPSEREGLTSLNESKEHTFLMNVLKEHIPKLNLHITEELLTCDTCLDGLQSVSSFLVNCSDVEQKITEYTEIKGTDDKGQIDLEDVQQLIIDPTIKLEIDSKDVTELKEECDQFQEECTVQAEIKHEEEMDNPELFIKTEEIYIKSEAGNCNSPQEFATKIRNDNRSSDISVLELQGRYKKCVDQHELTYKNSEEITMFKCTLCPHEAKCRSNLKRHELTHKSTSELTMFKCNLCPYEAKRRYYLKEHELTHKSTSELTMFKCELCPYEAKRRCHLKGHELTHKSTSELTMFKCELCPYEAKRRCHLKEHELIHESTSKLTMLKCELCSYETKFRRKLTRHKLIHKSPSNIVMFKCNLCTYEAKHRCHLKEHQLTHKSTSELTMFKCELCSYETKFRRKLTRHKLIHKNSSNIVMFKCNLCTYESKRRCHLNKHELTHKSNSELTMLGF